MSSADAYAAPAATAVTRPAAILWYRVFAVTSGVLYGTLAFVLATFSAHSVVNTNPNVTLAALAYVLPVLAFYGVAAAVPYKPWGWTYALIAIALGLPTILAPASVVLIIFWNRPLVKAAFARL